MGRNIVICSDGTGNTFDSHVTNVTRLIKCLALNDHERQVVVYDQGVGTHVAQARSPRIERALEAKRLCVSSRRRSSQLLCQSGCSTGHEGSYLATALWKTSARCTKSSRPCIRDLMTRFFCLALAVVHSPGADCPYDLAQQLACFAHALAVDDLRCGDNAAAATSSLQLVRTADPGYRVHSFGQV
jgi:hypothetical protein